jgi:hypothetical protein
VAVEAERAAEERTLLKLLPAAAAILVLLANAYLERYLKDDPDGYHLRLFIVLHTGLFLAVAVGTYMSRLEDVIRKSSIFPGSGAGRMVFVARSIAGHRLILALLVVEVLSLGVLYRSTRLAAIGTPILVVLLQSLLVSSVMVLCLVLTRAERRVMSLAAGVVFAGAILLIGTVVFRVQQILTWVPLLSPTASACLEAQRGGGEHVLSLSALLLLLHAVPWLIGRRYA